jgi:putative alpha-1,2-mannosidase
VSPYYYDDAFFQGMRKTHFMSGSCVVEYGPVTLIPSLTLDINAALTFHALSHANEEWSPGYYKVSLPESGVTIEAVNDNRAGIMSVDLTAAKQDTFYVIAMGFDTMYNKSSVSILSKSSMQTSNPVHRWYQATGQPAMFAGHHHIEFSEEALSYGIIEGLSEVRPGAEQGQSGELGPVAAYFEFSTAQYSKVMAAVGSSFVSRDKAQANMVAELGGSAEAGLFDLEAVRARVTAAWEDKLSIIDVTPMEV